MSASRSYILRKAVAVLIASAGLRTASRLSAQSMTIYRVPTTGSDPSGISIGPDGNMWFTENNVGKIGRLLPRDGQITEFVIPGGGAPLGIVDGPDRALWYADEANKIGRVQTDGSITEYTMPTPTSFRGPSHICVGPGGDLWFTENLKGAIGRSTTSGAITEFDFPGSLTSGIASAPDGRLWFTMEPQGIGQITTAGVITTLSLPTVGAYPAGITVGPDGALWVTESGVDKIARITLSGSITEFQISAPPDGFESNPAEIVAGTDGNLWFTEFFGHSIGRITPAGVVTHFPLPSTYSTSLPFAIASTQDGNIWFTEWRYSLIGKIEIGIVPTPTPTATPTPALPPTSTPVPSAGAIPILGLSGEAILAILLGSTGTLLVLLGHGRR